MKYNFDLVMSWATAEKKENSKESEWWNPKDGENTIRIIPGEGNWAVRAYKHFGVGPNKKHYWCPKSTPSGNRDWKKPCPICDFTNELYASGDPNDKEVANGLRAKERIMLNVVDLSEQEKGVKLFECPSTLWKRIDYYWKSKKWGNLADPENGYDFVVVKKGAKERANYDESYAVDEPSPMQNKEWINQIKDLWTKVEPYIKSPEALKSIMETGEDPEYSKEDITAKETISTNKASSIEQKDEIPEFKAPLKTETKPEEKTKPKKSKPSCFGVKYMEDADLCEACKYIELCETEFGAKLESDIDPEVDEILRSMK